MFEDISPTNSAPDLPAEHGLAGFQGHITDYLGEVTTDVYGDPLCYRQYDSSGNAILDNGGVPEHSATSCAADVRLRGGGAASMRPGVAQVDPTLLNGNPAPDARRRRCPAGRRHRRQGQDPQPGPQPLCAFGHAAGRSGWVQTTTLEGNHDWDAWVMEGATGLDTEFMVAGEPFPAIIFGYVQAHTCRCSDRIRPGSQGVVDAVKAYVPAKGGVGS